MSDKADQTMFRMCEDDTYTSVCNRPFKDKRLSLEARGLLVSLLSLPKNWQFNRAWARAEYGVGRGKMDKLIKQLKLAGYMRFIQERDAHGKMTKSVYLFAANPDILARQSPLLENRYSGDQPLLENPAPGEPASGESSNIQRKDITKEICTNGASAPSASGVVDIISPEETRRHRVSLYQKNALWPSKWGSVPTERELIDFANSEKRERKHERPRGHGRRARDSRMAMSKNS